MNDIKYVEDDMIKKVNVYFDSIDQPSLKILETDSIDDKTFKLRMALSLIVISRLKELS